MPVVRHDFPLEASLGATRFCVVKGIDARARLLYERGDARYSLICGSGGTMRVGSDMRETGVRALWRGEGLAVGEYRFRGGFSRYAENDEVYIVAEGGGKIKVGGETEPFAAGDAIDLGAVCGVYVLEIGEVSTLLKIGKEEV